MEDRRSKFMAYFSKPDSSRGLTRPGDRILQKLRRSDQLPVLSRQDMPWRWPWYWTLWHYANYERPKEWELRSMLESAAFFLPLCLQTKLPHSKKDLFFNQYLQVSYYGCDSFVRNYEYGNSKYFWKLKGTQRRKHSWRQIISGTPTMARQ